MNIQGNKDLKISLLPNNYRQKTSKKAKILLSVFLLAILCAYFYLYWQLKAVSFLPIWVLFGIAALYQIFTGKHFMTLFGDAYLKYNDVYIKCKPSIFKKEKMFFWKDIKKVSSKATSMIFEDKNGFIIQLPYTNMEYSVVQEVKWDLKILLKKKGLSIADNVFVDRFERILFMCLSDQ